MDSSPIAPLGVAISHTTTATLPDETSAPNPDTPTGVTGVSSVMSAATTATATMATVATSPEHGALVQEKRPRGWRLALARLLAWPVGSVFALLAGVALLAGPLVAFGGLVWALITDGRAIVAVIAIVRARQYSQLSAQFSLLDSASRVMFATVAYAALLYALMALMGGLLGRRWARLFVPSGLLFTAVALLGYFVGLLLIDNLARGLGLTPAAMSAIALYSLLDAIILAALLCDLRPESAAPTSKKPSASKVRKLRNGELRS